MATITTQQIDELTQRGIRNAIKYCIESFSDELDSMFKDGQVNAYEHIRSEYNLPELDLDAIYNEEVNSEL